MHHECSCLNLVKITSQLELNIIISILLDCYDLKHSPTSYGIRERPLSTMLVTKTFRKIPSLPSDSMIQWWSVWSLPFIRDVVSGECSFRGASQHPNKALIHFRSPENTMSTSYVIILLAQWRRLVVALPSVLLLCQLVVDLPVVALSSCPLVMQLSYRLVAPPSCPLVVPAGCWVACGCSVLLSSCHAALLSSRRAGWLLHFL